MPELLEKHLRDWTDKRYKPNPDGYLFVNSKGRPFPSDNFVKFGIHRAMEKLGIQTPKGVHIGIHCFRHGVTTELLESGTPIHVVKRMMRHGDSKVTLDHYACDRRDRTLCVREVSQRIGQNITHSNLESASAVKTA
jgi:integrase